MRSKVLLIAALLSMGLAQAQGDNDIATFRTWAMTPPMGWNSWDCYYSSVSENEVLQNAQYLVDHDLAKYGWEYVVVDIRWYCNHPSLGGGNYNQKGTQEYVLDEYGRYLPSPTRFPSCMVNGKNEGFKVLADRIHAMGLKFGIHIMRGVPKSVVGSSYKLKGSEGTAWSEVYNGTTSPCTWLKDNLLVKDNAAGQLYYNSIMDLYAEWGVDFLKIDDLSRPFYTDEIHMIRKAIDQTGRPIVLSLSPGKTQYQYAEECLDNANMWRMMDDLWDNWSAVDAVFNEAHAWETVTRPGNYADCDMLPLGQIAMTIGDAGYTSAQSGRWTRLTQNEQLTMMSLWGICHSPLFFGGEMTRNDAFTLSLLNNEEYHQMHKFGEDAHQVYNDEDNGRVAWTSHIGDTRYLALFQRDNTRWVVGNKALYKSETVAYTTDGHAVDVNIEWPEGEKTLVLVVDDGGDNYNYDHADWINPTLELRDGTEVPLTGEYKTRDYTKSYFNRVYENKNVQTGGKMTVMGTTYDRGFSADANAAIFFTIPNDMDVVRFKAMAAADDSGINQTNATTSIRFMVFSQNPLTAEQDESAALDEPFTFDLTQLGYAADEDVPVHDIWSGQDLGTSTGSISTDVPSHGVRLFRLGEKSTAKIWNEASQPYSNIAFQISEIEASYTKGDTYLYSIYDGRKGFNEMAQSNTWGSWSNSRPASQWLRYGWTDEVTASQVNLYFWTDTDKTSGAGNGVAVPASWKVQYYDDATATWKDVELLDGQSYTSNRQAVNSVQFLPVKTRQIKLVMQAQSNGSTYAALGVTEWEVIGKIEEKEIVYGDYPIQNVDFSKVHLTDKFWKARMQQNQDVTIPIALEQCEKTNRMLNFEKAAAILRGENIGYFDTENTFDDTDIYKILEGMAYSIQTNYSAEMDAKMDELIALVGSAQEPDGYLYTPRTAGQPGHLHSWVGANRWEKDPDLSHELYNCGHLYEAACAHYISTGKRSLLDIAIKSADLLVKDFLVGGLTYEPGHQIVEMGLVKMYRATGKEDYLKLAKYFLDLRGLKGVMRKEYSQTTKPVIMQDEAVGHAVRAAYMYSGMADVAAIMGDEAYLNAIDQIWENVVGKKYYITGGIGGKIDGEAFDVNYKLPNREAYCETCAAIANVYWNWRMFLLHGEAKYYDVIERTLYNGLISGISLTGDHFFYPNPLASNGTSAVAGRDVVRSEWFGCACCPSNLCRFTASVPGYIYAHRDNDLYVNLYIQGTGEIDMPGGTVRLTQTTEMPWQGAVSIRVDENNAGTFAMRLRLPGWANGQPVPSDLYTYLNAQTADIEVLVNGSPVSYEMHDGYMTISRAWAAGDVVSFELPMDVHKTKAHENVEADRGRLSIERGPVVYCLEWPDNNNQDWYITETAEAAPAWTDDLNGLMRLTITEPGTSAATHQLTAIPYYAWANRGKGGNMEVWVSSSKADYPVNIGLESINVVGEKEITIDYYPVNDNWATHTVSGMPVDDVPTVLNLPLSEFKLDMMYMPTDASTVSRTKCASSGNGFWLIKQGKEAGELFSTADDYHADRRIFLRVDGFYQTDHTVKVRYGQKPSSCQSGVYHTSVYMLAPRASDDHWDAYRVRVNFNLQGSLLDEDADYAPEASGITALTLRRTLKTNMWNTIVLPVALSEAQLKSAFGEAVKVAALESATDGQLNFTSVASTNANQPYMIRVDEDFNEATIDGVTIDVGTPTQEATGISFIGSYAALTDIPTGSYFVKDNQLLRASVGCTMKGTRAYFNVPAAQVKSLSIFIDGDEATGIKAIENGKLRIENSEIYNLAGLRMSRVQRGMNIVNGKKILY